RIFLCEATNLGLSTNFEILNWADLKTITFKEEFFGSKFTIVPIDNENLTVDYIPKTQARKLYQLAKEAMDKHQSQILTAEKAPILNSAVEDENSVGYQNFVLQPEEEPVIKEKPLVIEEEDELTLKLKKLKSLFDKQLITKEEYESKKLDLLSQL